MSKKNVTAYLCSACGSDFSKWHGRCPACGEWNTVTLVEHVPAKHKGGERARPLPLASVAMEEVQRVHTCMQEFNLVCGGGIVPGSVILIGGEPGIGKSTLALQIANSLKTLYVSGEESPAQLRHRAERLGVAMANISVTSCTVAEEIIDMAEADRPQVLIVDSIQTLSSSEAPGFKGSVSQIRESTGKLIDFAKKSGIPVIVIGHITKDGSIAGPKLLEHLVDTVLYFEGDFARDYRILRAFKNRFGSVNELGLFRMGADGLAEVSDKNAIFLNPFQTKSPGSAVSAAIEGSRVILFEVQSLVSFTSFSNPRRMSDGFDYNRLILIAAVLEKHAGLKLNSFDIFVNVAGGFRIAETAADLAVAMAVASSLKELPVPERTAFIGEISLSGEIRPVPQVGRRVQEFRHAGFGTLLVPAPDLKAARDTGYDGTLIGVRHIQEAFKRLF